MKRAPLVSIFLLAGCTSARQELPGSYAGDLTSNNQASVAQNVRPDGKGGRVATVRHFAGGTTATGVRVTVRDLGDVRGNPTFTADLDGLCTLRFQLLQGGALSSNLEKSSCGCVLEGQRVDGHTSVTGSYREGALSLDVTVALQGTGAYTGGCNYTFQGHEQP